MINRAWATVVSYLGTTLIAGCAAHDEQPGAADAAAKVMTRGLELATPKDGVQVGTLGRDIPAGADQEWCEVVALPGASDHTSFVGRTELAMTQFSHHLIVSMAPEGSTSLDAARLGEPIECPGAHRFGTDLVTLAASAQPYSSRELPAGIGFVVRGGQRLLFDYHSLNTGAETIHVRHRLNLHFVDHIDKPARTFGFYNQYIEIPPHSERSFSEDCRFKNDLRVWSLSRHTHRHGTDFRVFFAGGERDGELIWTSADWERDISYDFDSPLVVPQGAGFRWECAFNNPTDATLQFGPEASDEMCILFGGFAAVDDDASVGPQSCYRFGP